MSLNGSGIRGSLLKTPKLAKTKVPSSVDESDSHKSTIRFMILFEKTITSSIVVDPSRVVFNLPLFCPDRAGIGSRGSIL
jgi:hypothetical protein